MKLLIAPPKWMPAVKLSTQYSVLSTVFLLLLLAACSPASDVLPTAIDLNTIATNDAATRAASNESAAATIVSQTEIAAITTATSIAFSTLNAPTDLPPTWTPSPIPPIPTVSFLPTQEFITVPSTTGTIYYGFNGDSIAMLAADGSTDELILVGGKPADIRISPDEQWLAYTADDGEGVREVFAMSLQTEGIPDDQWYRSVRVSCLGFARVVMPVWSADTRILAFAASETVDGTLGIYTAELLGSNQCPMSNHQRGLVQTSFKDITGLTWNPDNTQLYLTSGAVYAVDTANGTLYPPLTQPTGFGPDSFPLYRPNSTDLYYLKIQRDDITGQVGGALGHVNTGDLSTLPLLEQRGTMVFANRIEFSPDGRFVLASGAQDVSLQNMDAGSAVIVVTGAKFTPQAILSPNSEYIAYVDDSAGSEFVEQVWVVDRRGNNRKQLTTHKEGTIAFLNWASQ